MRSEAREYLLVRKLRRRRVGVHARNPRVGIELVQLLGYQLRAEPLASEVRRAALRTFVRHRLRIAAIVAFEQLVVRVAVIGQRDCAVRAGYDLAAHTAADKIVVPAAADKEYRLLVRREVLLDLAAQKSAERRDIAPRCVEPQVGYQHLGQRRSAPPLAQRYKRITAHLRPPKGFERRGRARQ